MIASEHLRLPLDDASLLSSEPEAQYIPAVAAPTSIYDIASDSIVIILQFVGRPFDLASVREVDKTIFARERIGKAIEYLIHEVYLSRDFGFSFKDPILYRSDYLFVIEVKCLISAASASAPINGKGFWISTSWLANAKKYLESLSLPELSAKRGSSSKKQYKIRQRRGSDSLPPWTDINAEVTCQHGNVAPRSKKRLIEPKAWRFLRKFYPEGKEFYAPKSLHCELCSCDLDIVKIPAMSAPESRNRADRLPPLLQAVFNRKSGVPNDRLTHRVAMYNHFSDGSGGSSDEEITDTALEYYQQTRAAAVNQRLDFTPAASSDAPFLPDDELAAVAAAVFEDNPVAAHDPDLDYALALSLQEESELLAEDCFPDEHAFSDGLKELDHEAPTFAQTDLHQQQLIPGIYALVPRSWLKKWRSHVKDAAQTLPPIDCTTLLCPLHKQVMAPVHLMEFLAGHRRYLLAGLGQYQGEVVEVLSLEEWEALLWDVKNGLPEYTICFSLDGEAVTWSSPLCSKLCTPSRYEAKAQRRVQSNPQKILSGSIGGRKSPVQMY